MGMIIGADCAKSDLYCELMDAVYEKKGEETRDKVVFDRIDTLEALIGKLCEYVEMMDGAFECRLYDLQDEVSALQLEKDSSLKEQ